eukprot:SAG31_NODE_2608_length_5388_cov_5.001702_5_plen_354_part_00
MQISPTTTACGRAQARQMHAHTAELLLLSLWPAAVSAQDAVYWTAASEARDEMETLVRGTAKTLQREYINIVSDELGGCGAYTDMCDANNPDLQTPRAINSPQFLDPLHQTCVNLDRDPLQPQNLLSVAISGRDILDNAGSQTFTNTDGREQGKCEWNAVCSGGECTIPDSGGVATTKYEALNTQGCTSASNKGKCLVNTQEDVYGASFPTGTTYRANDPRPCAELAATNRLRRSFRDRLRYNNQTMWNFLGMQETGIYRTWPTIFQCRSEEVCSGCSDPRYRGWYAGAASGPKNVAIVVDTSGSMSSRGRGTAAREATSWVVNTLTAADKATLITFGSTGKNGASHCYAMTV